MKQSPLPDDDFERFAFRMQVLLILSMALFGVAAWLVALLAA